MTIFLKKIYFIFGSPVKFALNRFLGHLNWLSSSIFMLLDHSLKKQNYMRSSVFCLAKFGPEWFGML